MAPSTASPRLSRISILCFFVLFITATQASSILFPRAEACGGNTGLQQCGGDFPSTFCCPKDSTCMDLNSGSVKSVICCPAGSDCAYIQPTTCDTTQLNATLHPDNQMHLSETEGIELPKCGDKCCSLGYTCQGSMCAKDKSPSPSSSPSSTSPTTPSPTSPASASQTSNCSSAPVPTGNSFSGRSFAAGFIPGIVIGALLTLLFLWLLKCRRETHFNKPRYSGDFGHVARQISDPIYDPQHAARTDFMRRGSHSVGSPNSTDRIIQGMKENNAYTNSNSNNVVHGFTPRIKSMWDRTPKLNFGFSGGLPPNPAAPIIRAGNPHTNPYQTPPQKPKRIHSYSASSSRSNSTRSRSGAPKYKPQQPHPHSGSSETIDILMPHQSGAPPQTMGGGAAVENGFLAPPQAPGMKRGQNRDTADSAHTTFTKLMERAGFDEPGRQEVRNWGSGRL